MSSRRVTERIVRENVRACKHRHTRAMPAGFAIGQGETARGAPRYYYVICAGPSGDAISAGGYCECACPNGDAPSQRQADIRAAWVEDERRKLYAAAQAKGPLL